MTTTKTKDAFKKKIRQIVQGQARELRAAISKPVVLDFENEAATLDLTDAEFKRLVSALFYRALEGKNFAPVQRAAITSCLLIASTVADLDGDPDFERMGAGYVPVELAEDELFHLVGYLNLLANRTDRRFPVSGQRGGAR